MPEHMPTHDLVLTDWAVLGMGRRAPDGLGNVLGVREERDLRAPLNQVRPGDLWRSWGWGAKFINDTVGGEGASPPPKTHSQICPLM